MAYNEDSSASGNDEPWIQWFCGLKGHEMFCEVERSYIIDGFNLYGLRSFVSNFSDCLDLILDRIGADDSDDSHLTQSACTLYGLIHARYIITAHGLDAMYNKYAAKEFGTCPLIQCQGQPVLPVGLRDEMGADTVKIFCPKCQNVYHPPPIRSRSGCHVGSASHGGSGGGGAVDGAAFGTTFPHLFLLTFNNLAPDAPSPESSYVPRVFGFRVHPSARQRNGSSNGAELMLRPSSGNAATSRRGYATITAAAVAVAGVQNGNIGESKQEDIMIDTGATNAEEAAANSSKDQIAGGANDTTGARSAAGLLETVTDDKTVKMQNTSSKNIRNDCGAAKRKSKGAGDGTKSKSTSGDNETGSGGKEKRQRRQNGT